MGAAARVNVEVIGTIGELDTAMDRAQETVTRAASTMQTQTDKMGSVFEGMAHRFEHSGVMIAFAVNNMMDGSQKGVDRALHSIALLGFAFGPVVGAVTTATALIAEQIKNMVEKSGKEIDEFKKKLDDFTNAGNNAALLKKREELLTGLPAKDGKIVPKSEMVPGAFKGSLEDLEAEAAKVQRSMGGFAGLLSVTPELKAAREQLEAIDKALAAAGDQRARLMSDGAMPKVTTSVKSDKRVAEDAEKANAKKLALAMDLARALDRIDEEYTKGSEKYLDEQLKAAGKASEKKQEQEASAAKQEEDLRTKAQHNLEEDRAAGGKRIAAIESSNARRVQEVWTGAFDSISGAFEHAFQQMQGHGDSFSKYMQQVGRDMLSSFIRAELKMVEAHIAANMAKQSSDEVNAAQSKALSLSKAFASIAADAASAAASAYSGTMEYLGPILGPFAIPVAGVAAGAAYAGVTAFEALASAAGGFDIPKGLNPMTQLHEEEMVLPAHLANAVRGMAGGGGAGGGDVHFHVTATDSTDVKRHLDTHGAEYARAVMKHVNRGAATPASAAGRRT